MVFRYQSDMELKGVKRGESAKHEGLEKRSTKGLGEGDTGKGACLRSLQGCAIEAPAPPVPEVKVQTPMVRFEKRGGFVRKVPFPDSLRPDHPDPASADRQDRHPGGTDNRRTRGKAKEPIQAKRVGKHHPGTKRSVK